MSFRDAEGLIMLADAREARRIDSDTISHYQVPSRVLMEVAGQRASDAIVSRIGKASARCVVLCGPGNNGGDGYVVARRLLDLDWHVECLALAEPQASHPDALDNFKLFKMLGGSVSVLPELETERIEALLSASDVIVEALFGTGLTRKLSGQAQALVAAANRQQSAYRVALDIPAGISADTGQELGEAFRADLTLTFGLSKVGLNQQPGEERAGETITLPIGWPRAAVEAVGTRYRRCDARAAGAALPRRKADSHKGSHGHLGIVGGSQGMEGAAVLSGLAALRSGCGLVTWYQSADTTPVMRPPELLLADLAPPFSTEHDCFLVGPGLGRADHSNEALQSILASKAPAVLDADALNILAPISESGATAHTVMTPHPGEAARLLGCSSRDVQANRLSALNELVQVSGAIVVLKGAGTLVGAPGREVVIIAEPCPALAVGGSGDVLAGVIASLMAQGIEPFRAAYTGAWLHLKAARSLERRRGQRGISPSEVANALPEAMLYLERGWVP